MFKPTAGYSQVAEVKSGKLVYVAGQVPIDRDGNLVSKDDFLSQAEQVFKNLQAAVEATGGTCADIRRRVRNFPIQSQPRLVISG